MPTTQYKRENWYSNRWQDKGQSNRNERDVQNNKNFALFSLDKDGNVSRAPRIRQTVSDTHKRPIKTSNNPQQAKHKQASKGDEPPKISSGLSPNPLALQWKKSKAFKAQPQKNKFFRYSKCLDPLVVGPCFPLDDCCKVLSATCHRREGRLAL